MSPGPELRRLHDAILRQDRALDRLGDAVARPPPEIYVGGPGGVPHAETVAAGRLDAAADQAAERAGLRVAEDALAEKVVALQVARERSGADPGPAAKLSCARSCGSRVRVRGRRLLFGRERLVAEMVGRPAGASLMGIVGPSGGGKLGARAGRRRGRAVGRRLASRGAPGDHLSRALETGAGASTDRHDHGLSLSESRSCAKAVAAAAGTAAQEAS